MFFGFCRMISARAASQAVAHGAQDRLCIAVCLTSPEKVVGYTAMKMNRDSLFCDHELPFLVSPPVFYPFYAFAPSLVLLSYTFVLFKLVFSHFFVFLLSFFLSFYFPFFIISVFLPHFLQLQLHFLTFIVLIFLLHLLLFSLLCCLPFCSSITFL